MAAEKSSLSLEHHLWNPPHGTERRHPVDKGGPSGYETDKDVKSWSEMDVLEYVLFGVVVLANFALGLYFSFRKHRRTTVSNGAVLEVFLGSRSLTMLPLAASTVASILSSTGLVALPAHYYAYGWHLFWGSITPLLLFPLATHVFVPVVYGLGVTSVFEYIRLRFNNTISFTACVIYIFLTQSIGAISIFAASLAIEAVFHVPLLWGSIAIGVSGTIYTTLGGLRGVVWTDCVQFLLILCAPVTIIAKVTYDAMSPGSMVRPLDHLEIRKYIGEYSLDFTNDENIWSCFFGSFAPVMCRFCFDQVVAQRLLASRTFKDAKWNAFTSSVLYVFAYGALFLMHVALTVWLRGCDPLLSGAVDHIDQVLPYYINTRLVEIPGFVGLFLAGVVCAATSTTSSTINSQAAIVYVDIIAPLWKDAPQYVLWITRCTALVLGITMTVYSVVYEYAGSLGRVFLMVFSCMTSPYIGLCLLAVLFPFVHSKGAGVATIVTSIFQLCHIAMSIQRGTTPARMPVSLEYCPENVTAYTTASNVSNMNVLLEATRSEESFHVFRMSHYWISFFGLFATLVIGVLISALTGEMWREQEQPGLSSDLLVRIWRRPSPTWSESQVRTTLTLKSQRQEGGAEVEDFLAPAADSNV